VHGRIVKMNEHAGGWRPFLVTTFFPFDLDIGSLGCCLVIEVGNWSIRGGQCHAQHRRCRCQQITSRYEEFEARHATALDGLNRSLYLGFNHHKTLGVDSGDPLHHGSADNMRRLFRELRCSHDNTLDRPKVDKMVKVSFYS